MTYRLGIDLGTTFTAAAVWRDGRTQIVPLGDRTAEMASVVLLRQDGVVLAGSAADRRASSEPERVAREFKRRLGDPIPLIVGGAPQPATSLLGHLLRAVVAKVTEVEGEAPALVTLTHPANWGPYKRDLFDQVPRLAEVDKVRMLTEPEAAALYYASTERLADGATVAVYDLGGGTFDATVLRKAANGFDILGEPQGIEGLGGIDFDEAVYSHVRESLGNDVTTDRPSLIKLRQECVLAKEALSADTEATIPVMLPGMHTHIRLTRAEFEDMIRPALADTLTTLRGALRSASVEPSDLTSVLLVGGSSRIPLVAKMVSAELKSPIAVDTHPKHAVALGAAAYGAHEAPPAETGTADTLPLAAEPRPMPEPAPHTAHTGGERAVLPGMVAAGLVGGGGGPTATAAPPGEPGPADTGSHRFGAGDAPPPLEGSTAPARSAKRSALFAGVIVLLLGLGWLGTGVFASPAPVVQTNPTQPAGSLPPAEPRTSPPAPTATLTTVPAAPVPVYHAPVPAPRPTQNTDTWKSESHHPTTSTKPTKPSGSSTSASSGGGGAGTSGAGSAGGSGGGGSGNGGGSGGGGNAGSK